MEPISFKQTSKNGLTALHIGTVVDVIKAVVPDSLKNLRFSAGDYSYGFQIGSPKNFASLGEALLVNQTLFACSSDKTSQDYGSLIAGEEFVTSAIFLLPKNAEPSYEVKVHLEKGITLYDLYDVLYKKIQKPIALTGFISFSKFHANHIEAPPIDGLNVFENPSIYYTRPQIQKNDEYGFVVGVMTDFDNKKFEILNDKLETVLYKNPNEKKELLSFHLHVLTLNQSCIQESQIDKRHAKQVLHLFADNTEIIKADLKIYVIEDIQEVIWH